jgi:hypothetical protein
MPAEEFGGAKGRLRQLERMGETIPLSTFLKRIDKRSRLSKQDRLKILEQALFILETNYVHLPLKRAMHAIDPIRRLKLLKFRLEESESELETETQFHRRLLDIFASLRDLHTIYQLPAAFTDQVAFLPFLIEQYFVPDKTRNRRGGTRKAKENSKPIPKFIVSGIARHFYAHSQHAGPEVTNFERGVEVLRWNGVPIQRAIEKNGETQSGSNLEARFARGLDSLTIRPLETSMPPDELSVSITYRSKRGEFTLHDQQWRVGTLGAPPLATRTSRKKRAAIDIKKTKINLVKRKLYAQQEPPPAIRNIPVSKEFADFFYAQARSVYGKEIGYVRVYSFNVDDPDQFVEEFKRVITLKESNKQKGFPQEGLIIDVRANGGGKIRAGERLLQLFTPRRIQPELFEFINTPQNLEICKWAPRNWELSKWAKSISEAVETGAMYSEGFPLNDEEACNDIGQVYYGPAILITDALSYSTTDMFAAGFQDNNVGLVLGTSGNTGAGGANNWTYDDLRTAVRRAPKSPYKPLPKGADIGVSMRRSIRVGPRVGKLLEELGVKPEKLHYVTKNDLLYGNVDLVRRAFKLLNNKPIYSLSLERFRGQTLQGVRVSCSSKVAKANKAQNISYLNIDVDGRWYKTINARNGSLKKEKVILKGRRRKRLLVQAFDEQNNPVAAYRRIV